MRKIFTETKSRVEQQFIFCDTGPFATHNMFDKKAFNVSKHVRVLRGILHCLRLTLHMHQAHRQARFGRCLQRSRFGQRADIIDNMRANSR